jgi:hypothetical protein
MLEPGWLELVVYDFSHFDNTLSKGSPGLLTGSVSNKRRLSLTIGHALGLCGFNLVTFSKTARVLSAVACTSSCEGRSIERALSRVFSESVCQRDEILELRLNQLSMSLPLVCNSIVANIALAVHLKG